MVSTKDLLKAKDDEIKSLQLLHSQQPTQRILDAIDKLDIYKDEIIIKGQNFEPVADATSYLIHQLKVIQKAEKQEPESYPYPDPEDNKPKTPQQKVERMSQLLDKITAMLREIANIRAELDELPSDDEDEDEDVEDEEIQTKTYERAWNGSYTYV
jgi:hypothetical protein